MSRLPLFPLKPMFWGLLLLLWLLPGAATGAQLSLDEAIQATLRNHPLQQAALEKQLAAEAAASAASANLLPKFNASYSYFHLRDKPYGIFGPAGKIGLGDDDIFTWRISAVQPLFTGFALTTRKKMARLELRGRKLAREQLQLDLVKNAKLAYYQIYLAEKHLQVAAKTVTNLKAHEEDAAALYKEGIVAYNDLLQARVALAEARRQQEMADRNLDLARSRLNLLMNRDITTPFTVKSIAVELDEDFGDLGKLFAEALETRPEIKHLEVALKQAKMAVTLARSSYYPTISLVGSYEQTGHDFDAQQNDYRNKDTAAIGIQADWTFFEWGKTRALEKEQSHAHKALEHKLEEAKNQVRLEVKTAVRDLEMAVTNTRTAETAVTQAEENLRMTTQQYRQQMATSTTLLDAVTFLDRTRNGYYDSLYGYLMARAELERALGHQN
ncbi:MAG: TolC family protein [Deltaproteobacteria bacterium]|nr:TolC family protein [Deltaproteobacteria bacterium]